MTDVAQLSDADLLRMYQNPQPHEVEGMVRAEAQRQGVDPEIAARVMRKESSGRAGAVSPKGAIGAMQLMPGTAADLGVDPHDVDQNIRGGVTYLKQQMDHFGDPKLALAAYNAGPARVTAAGGVPHIAETEDYVRSIAGGGDLSKLSDDDLRALYAKAAPAPEAAPTGAPAVINAATGKPYNDAQEATYAQLLKSGQIDRSAAPGSKGMPRGLASSDDVPKPGEWFVGIDGSLKQAPGAEPKVPLLEAALGAGVDAAKAVGRDGARWLKADGRGLPLLNGRDKALGSMASDVANIVAGPVGVVSDRLITQPIASALDVLPTYQPGHLTLGPGFSIGAAAPRKLTDEERHASHVRDVNTALSAAKAVDVPAFVKPTTMTLDELQAAKGAAYDAVDATGATYHPTDTKALASTINTEVGKARFNPRLHPKTAAILDDVNDLVNQATGYSPTLSELDDLRKVVGRDVSSSADAGEQRMGSIITKAIDHFIDTTAPVGGTGNEADLIKTARGLNTRYRKMTEVSDRVASADLRAGTSGNGGNVDNATRQKLRPLIDPTSSQQLRNLTPDELAALTRVVKGGPGQNVLRMLSAFDPTAGKLSGLLQAGAVLPTHGLSLATMPVGMASRAAESLIAKKNVADLLDLISSGGMKAARPLPGPVLPGSVPILSVPGAVGAGELAAPLLPTPSPRSGDRSAKSGSRKPQPQRR